MIQSTTPYLTSKLLTALTLAVAGLVGFSGIAEAATCVTCHALPGQVTPTDIRPVDSVFRNITTGGFKGSHDKHIPAPTVDANTCTPCHGPGVATYDTKHRNGFINVTSSTAPGLSYSKGSKFPQSGAANLTLGTCSTASCHADPYGAATVTTPVWGTPAANCTACHTTPIGANGPATGSHTTTAGHAVACTSCHEAGTSATSMPSAAHNDGNITIVNVGYPAIVAKHVAGSGYTSCSAASCHANVYGAGTVTTPVWGASAGCSACHTVAIDATGPNTGSHAKHGVTDCTLCHAAGTTQITKPSTGHLDGTITVTNGYPVTAKHAAGSYTGTCSTASCHADPYSAGMVTTPVWGTAAGCAACHTGVGAFTGAGTAPATGVHNTHMALAGASCGQCHTGAVAGVSGGTNHLNGTVNVTGGYPVTAKHAPGTYTGACSTTLCHGASSPNWGTNTANNTCTKCHGTGALTVTAANRNVVAPSDPAATDKGKVSANVKTGAHQTHLLMLNGLSPVGTIDERCQNCHGTLPTTGTHATGSSTPVFQGLATKNGALTASYAGANCSNTYCHNPAGTGGTLNAANAGTGITPSWTNAGYIADGTLKTQANCGVCHKSPGDAGFTSTTDHGPTAMPLGINTDCSPCHGHNGDLAGAAGQQHMDGIKYGNGSCDVCHGYPPMSAAQLSARVAGTYVNAKLESYPGGGGHHTTHLLTTVSSSEGFAPCLPCHPSSSHNTGNGVVVKANVNVNDPADTTFRFDDSRSKRYNTVTMSCSNVSCHYQPTTAW